MSIIWYILVPSRKLVCTKPCAYCGTSVPAGSETDHVVARAFLRWKNVCPQDPIYVPACRECQNSKGRLENYTAILLTMLMGREPDERQKRGIIDMANHGIDIKLNVRLMKSLWGKPVAEINATGLIKWGKIEWCLEWMAMGIAYHHYPYQGKKPSIMVEFPFREKQMMELEYSQKNILRWTEMIQPDYLFADDNMYKGEVRYFVAYKENRILICIQVYDPYLGKVRPSRKTFLAIFDRSNNLVIDQ